MTERDESVEVTPPALAAPLAALRRLAGAPGRLLAEIGALARLLSESARWSVRRPFRAGLVVDAMEFIGVQSMFIVMLTGTFVGMVFGIQLVDGFRQFNAENQTGSVIGLALARELAPVFSAMMVTSRAGSAISTELGSMRVSDQIDALSSMAVNPVQYLVVPRLIAGLIMVPVLAVVFGAMGVLGSWLVCVQLLQLDPGIFFDRICWYVDAPDVMQGVLKAVVFGLAIALISCKQGFYATGGAAGVGQATNRAVVQSSVSVLILDFLITASLLQADGGGL